MANYVVSDTNLTLIADAIRAKSGHNELLEWPNEYKTSIDNLNPVDMCIKTATDNIVSVSDAAQYDAKNTTIKIEPVQNLHGYDHPWPAGGGKNKLNIDESAMVANGYDRFFPIALAAGTYSITCFGTFGNGYGSAIDLDSSIGTSGGTVKQIVQSYAFGRTQGATFSFTLTQEEAEAVVSIHMRVNGNGITFADIEAGKLQIELGSSTTYAPYSNICPISGWTGAKVTRRGKNLLKNNGTSGSNGGITWTMNSDGSIALSGTAGDNYVYININTLREPQILANGTVQLVCSAAESFNPEIGGINFQNDIYIDGTYSSTIQNGTPTRQYSGGEISVGVSRLRIAPNTVIPNGTVYYPLITIGSTIDEWMPYQGQTYDITFPSSAGAVYGGTLDVTNGVLTVDRAIVDLGTLTWTKITTSGDHWRFWAMLNTMRLRGQMISSQYRQIGATEQYIGAQGIANQASESNVLAMVSDERYADAVAFKAAMSGVQLVYELAAPITYTLTPQQIAMLRGNNALWADTGDVTLKYFTTAFEDLAEEIGFAEGGDY